MRLFKTTVASIAVLAAASAVTAKDVSEEMRDVDAFTKVSLEGSMDVEIQVGPKQSVKVIADSDIIDKLRTRVVAGELEIDLKRGEYYRIKKMQVIITVPSLEKANLQGSGDMMIEGVKRETFDVGVRGSGDLIVEDTEVTNVQVDLKGSGDIVLSGSCDAIHVELQGSGDVRARKMKCKSADVSVRGSGDVDLFASEIADLTVYGSGDIVVAGKPDKISQRVRGSGDIHVR